MKPATGTTTGRPRPLPFPRAAYLALLFTGRYTPASARKALREAQATGIKQAQRRWGRA